MTNKKHKALNITDMLQDHARLARLKRLVNHLTIGMSLMSNTYVSGEVYQGRNSAPAMTTKVEFNPPAFGGTHFMGRRGQTGSYVDYSKPRYLTIFEAGFLPDTLPEWLGTAWHELGHVMWSPMSTTIRITTGFNLLEDARIEGLLIAKWPRTEAPLLAALRHFMDNMITKNVDPKELVFAYAWVAGRTHLPYDLRMKLRKTVDPKDAKEIDRIYRDYLAMGAKLDEKKANNLALELDAILGTTANPLLSCAQTMASGMDGTTDEDGTQIDQDYVDQVGPQAGDTSGEGESQPKPKTIEETRNANREQAYKVKEILESINEALGKALAGNADLQQEVAELEHALRSAGTGLPGRSASSRVAPPTAEAVRSARLVRKEAARFNDDSGKGLVRYRDYGRLRPMRYERTEDLDIAYDMWEPGLDQEMYIMVVMDISGSMRGQPITSILYALEVGLADVATVEPVLFHDNYEFPSTQNTPHRMVYIDTQGGTDPTEALAYAHHKMLNSGAANKLVVFLTDGEFNNSEAYSFSGAYIADMIDHGVNVRLLGLGIGARLTPLIMKTRNRVSAGEGRQIKDLSELPGIVGEWTRTVLTGGVRH